MSSQELPRDVFIGTLYEEARRNKNIVFLCADFGARALDDFRRELKDQFFHVGICEQNMIDVAAGLAQSGKIVYTYAMASFITLRCLEQIKVALGIMNLPVTILGVGAGFSYDDAGPTHYAIEDVTCMRGVGNLEIYSPGDTHSTRALAQLTYTKPGLRYVRLDRKYLPDLYSEQDKNFLTDALVQRRVGKEACLVTTGYMHLTAKKIIERCSQLGFSLGLVDAFKLWPLEATQVEKVLAPYDRVITLEEHFLSGGLGSIISEIVVDRNLNKKVLRLGLENNYHLENGGRAYLHKLCGLDDVTLTEKIITFLKRS